MLLCPKLKQKYLAVYEENNWVSGVSSPSIAQYTIKTVTSNQFVIDFGLQLQGKLVGSMVGIITVAAQPKHCIATYTQQWR